jgi:hypothetical protein
MNLFAILAIVVVVAVIVFATVKIISASKKEKEAAKAAGNSDTSDVLIDGRGAGSASSVEKEGVYDNDHDPDENPDASSPMSKEEEEAYKKEKQEREWSDPNEHAKYVCMGGKVQCPFASPDSAEIIVTSTTIQLQDKPWATIKDKDGKVNFNFVGVCKHPSQQKPGSPPPPCKTVISLGEWKDYSETKVDNINALVVQSTIACMISGQDLKIIDSGQKATLDKTEPAQEEPKQKIVSIELLRGETVQTGIVNQYVNIKRDAKYVDGTDITHIDSLGQKLRLKVKFDIAGTFNFKVKLTPDTTNAVYSADEKTRNPNFKYSSDEIEFITDSNGEKVIDADKVFTSPAGGDIFTISAKDDEGNEVTAAGEVKTERMLYYVEAKMNGLVTCANNLDVFKNEYIKHGITFHNLPSVLMPHMENIGANDGNTFKNNVQTAYSASQGPGKNPYCVVIAYSDHLAVKDVNKEIPLSNVQGGISTPINIIIKERDVSSDIDRQYALWNNLVTGEDWFVECFFLKNGGNAVTDKVTIQKNKCIPMQTSGYPTGYFGSVNIDVSGLPSEIGTVTLKVNRVNRMRAGLSFGGTNIVAICTKAWWQAKTTQNQNEVIVHEVGHQFKMVPDGSGKLPDKTTNFYDSSKGHVGNHCHTGIPTGQAQYNSQTDGALSQCVMYGATNGHSDFCSDCAKAVKKMDLSNGV